jgi:hypothetical protein
LKKRRKSRTKRTSKTRRTHPTKRTTKGKFKIPKPANIRKIDDDTVIIENYDSPKQVSGSFRKSFHELTKEDVEREYSATIDYKPNTSSKLHQVDIQRGKSGRENPDGRASVISRVDRNDEIAIHNHPEKSETAMMWERPSGGDISNIIWLKDEGYHLKASYVKSANGQFIRYRVTDIRKARKGARMAKDEFNAVATSHEKKKYHNYIDWKIETKYHQIYMEQIVLANQKTVMSDEARQRMIILDKKHIDEIKAIEDDPNLTQKEKDIKIQKRSTEILKKMNAFDKRHTKKNPKYLKRTMPDRKQELIIKRRSFNAWSRWLDKFWGVEVKRMPKGFKHPIYSQGDLLNA